MYFLCPLIFLTTLQSRQTTSKLKLPWTLLRIKTASACCYQHQLFSMKKNERLQRDRMGAARYFRVHNRASNEPSRRLRKVLQGLQCQSHKGRVISKFNSVKNTNFFWDRKKISLTHWKTVFWVTEHFWIKWTF